MTKLPDGWRTGGPFSGHIINDEGLSISCDCHIDGTVRLHDGDVFIDAPLLALLAALRLEGWIVEKEKENEQTKSD